MSLLSTISDKLSDVKDSITDKIVGALAAKYSKAVGRNISTFVLGFIGGLGWTVASISQRLEGVAGWLTTHGVDPAAVEAVRNAANETVVTVSNSSDAIITSVVGAVIALILSLLDKKKNQPPAAPKVLDVKRSR